MNIANCRLPISFDTIGNWQSAIGNLLNITMHIELKDLSHNPVYAQVREQIEAQIKSKAVSPGESLPSPAALATKLSVDKGEIQRAYFELEQSGLVKKQTGKDMFGKPKVTYCVA